MGELPTTCKLTNKRLNNLYVKGKMFMGILTHTQVKQRENPANRSNATQRALKRSIQLSKQKDTRGSMQKIKTLSKTDK